MIKLGTLLLFSLFVFLSANAQKIESLESNWANKIQIDGHLDEWGDSLAHYFAPQDLRYSFSNDNKYLYVAIQVKNKDKQIQAAFNGFNVQIKSDRKKKEGSSFSFPMPERAAFRALSDQEFSTSKDPVEMALNSVRAYYVHGFPSILDGQISLDNTYGIRATALIDSAGNLCYESAIPLDRLNLSDNKRAFAINLKINGLIRTQYTDSGPMGNLRNSPYGYGGYGNDYNQRPRTVIRDREEPGIWQYLNLAIQP
jgi:hypothetical protein